NTLKGHDAVNAFLDAAKGQIVLVLQGGGALGAYQVGVYEALHEAGIEPDWVIGTSIGAINAAIIAGNAPKHRVQRLHEFWKRVEQHAGADALELVPGVASALANLSTMVHGLTPFFGPNPASWFGPHAPVGLDHAAYYTTAPLRETLSEIIDFDCLNGCETRLTVARSTSRAARCVISITVTRRLRWSTSWRRARCRRHFPR